MSHSLAKAFPATLLLLLCPAALAAQGQPAGALLRTFKAGDVQRYRVELTIRSEVSGQRPAQIGEQTYAEPFSENAVIAVSWSAARRVVSVADNGTAEIEETLSEFSDLENVQLQQAAFRNDLLKALQGSLLAWTREPPTMLYRETRQGQILALAANSAPVLDEAPPLLTLWLRRALRPTVPLPDRPPREGDRWSEPRAVRLPPWTDVQGTETVEWRAGPLPERSVVKLINLHVVQQIAGRVPSQEGAAAAGQAHFHAESLSAVVHLGVPMYGGYGALHSATRSASREVTHVVDAVPNLSEPAIFRARISVEVRISIQE